MSEPGELAAGRDIAERIELRWAMFVGAVVLFLIVLILFTAVHWSTMPPSRVELVDATTLQRAGEFTQDNLGTAMGDRGDVVVHLLAEQYAFRPHCMVVPQGVPVTFRATSSDVVHGFQIIGTNVNSMLVPGYVSTFVFSLDETGERVIPCHEFCGVGHAAMWAVIHVVPANEFRSLLAAHRRVSCD
jgi:cytochrome c oxidase subunit II